MPWSINLPPPESFRIRAPFLVVADAPGRGQVTRADEHQFGPITPDAKNLPRLLMNAG